MKGEVASQERTGSARQNAWMVGIALLLRVGYVIAFHTYRFPATNDHFWFGFETGSIAGAIARGEGFSSPFGTPTGLTTWIAPVYPYFCAAVFKVFGLFSDASAFAILSFNSLCGALTCIPIREITRRTAGEEPAIWAGWCWAVVPIFFQWPTTWVWEMAASALLLSMAFWSALMLGRVREQKWWVGFGLFWGLAALTNPALVTFLPFSIAWPLYEMKTEPVMKRLRLGAITLVVLVLVVTPWMVRNSMLYHRPTFIRGNFGFELHLGNFHFSNVMGWGGYHPTANPREMEKFKRIGEGAYIAESQQIAMKFIRENPGEFLELTGQRFVDFWDGKSIEYNPRDRRWIIYWLKAPWPRYIYFSLSLAALWGLLLALGAQIRGAWLFASLIFYPAAYYLTYTNPRYRHAIEPEMSILAVYFVYGMVEYIKVKAAAKDRRRGVSAGGVSNEYTRQG